MLKIPKLHSFSIRSVWIDCLNRIFLDCDVIIDVLTLVAIVLHPIRLFLKHHLRLLSLLILLLRHEVEDLLLHDLDACLLMALQGRMQAGMAWRRVFRLLAPLNCLHHLIFLIVLLLHLPGSVFA